MNAKLIKVIHDQELMQSEPKPHHKTKVGNNQIYHKVHVHLT